MTYAADNTIDFVAIARELGAAQVRSNGADASVSTRNRELVPTEVRSRMQREGDRFLKRPSLNGSTVDQEGLTNNYAVEPTVYYSLFPSPEQMKQYALQGAAAVLLITGLIITSVAVS
jgi:hypothetical protein